MRASSLLRNGTPADVIVDQCRYLRLPMPAPEYPFHPTRRFRFDLAWPRPDAAPGVALEIEGGLFLAAQGQHAGRHMSPVGLKRDLVKYNDAAVLGWLLLRVLPEHCRKGDAIVWVEAALKHLRMIP